MPGDSKDEEGPVSPDGKAKMNTDKKWRGKRIRKCLE